MPLKTIKIDLPRELQSVEIHTFADEHIGDDLCDMKRLYERIEYVKNTPNAYCILNLGCQRDTPPPRLFYSFALVSNQEVTKKLTVAGK